MLSRVLKSLLWMPVLYPTLLQLLNEAIRHYRVSKPATSYPVTNSCSHKMSAQLHVLAVGSSAVLEPQPYTQGSKNTSREDSSSPQFCPTLLWMGEDAGFGGASALQPRCRPK